MSTALTVYRTFDELLDAAQIDMPAQALESSFQPQQLIKVAAKINYDLGVKISVQRNKLLEIKHGKVKLPYDFFRLNFALLAEGRHREPLSVQERDPGFLKGYYEGVVDAQNLLDRNTVGQFNTTLNILPGSNTIEHTLQSKDLVVQVVTPDGSGVSVSVFFPDDSHVILYSEYQQAVLNARVVIVGARTGTAHTLPDSCELVSTTGQDLVIKYIHGFQRDTYHRVYPLKLRRGQGFVGEDLPCFFNAKDEGFISGNFLITSVQSGTIMLNYQSTMEDDEGNLLVLNHPRVDDYYEYALKERALENLYLSGEDVLQKLQYIQTQKLPRAKGEALSYTRTPDFAELKETVELNRKAQMHKYYTMFR